LSENTAKSRWVDWEMRESVKLGKAVIGVHKGDRPPRNMPKAVKELGIEVIPWRTAEITKAIDKAARQRE